MIILIIVIFIISFIITIFKEIINNRAAPITVIECDYIDSYSNKPGKPDKPQKIKAPFFKLDEVQALNEQSNCYIEYIRVLEHDRRLTVNNLEKLKLDKKIADYKLKQAKVQEKIEKIYDKYNIRE